MSEIASINTGVPKRGLLSLLLYNIFVSDHPTSPTLVSFYLQTHLDLMENWYTKWKFNGNQIKLVNTNFTLRQVPCPIVLFYGFPIPSSPIVKYIG